MLRFLLMLAATTALLFSASTVFAVSFISASATSNAYLFPGDLLVSEPELLCHHANRWQLCSVER